MKCGVKDFELHNLALFFRRPFPSRKFDEYLDSIKEVHPAHLGPGGGDPDIPGPEPLHHRLR